MKLIRILMVLALVSFYCPAWADQTRGQIISDNVNYFQKWFESHLDDFSKFGKPSETASVRSVASAHGSDYKKFNKYDQAASTPYGKKDLMEKLSMLATSMSQTAGTVSGAESALKLMTISTGLSSSKDPDLQTIGQSLAQESTAIKAGNTVAADQAASTISAMPTPVVSAGYQPTPTESANSQALAQVVGGVLASVAGVLGNVLTGGLLAALGVTGGANGAISGVASSGARAAAVPNGQPGAVVINGTGSVVNSGINNAGNAARSSINSSGTGGAPSAQ